MAKQRKTREEKIALSDKRQIYTQQYTYSLPTTIIPTIPIAKKHAQIPAYNSLTLRKTFTISFTLLVIELVLYLLLHQHVLTLPFAQY